MTRRMFRASTPQRASGFTLIELLVVIAIIAILAAILFPVFAQAREKARQAACLSNCKQMSLAVMQYTNDFDELLPVIGDNATCRGRWQWQIFPYVKNEQVFTCPNIPDNTWSSKTKLVSSVSGTCTGTYQVSDADISGYGWSAGLNYDTRQWGPSPTSAQTTASPGFSLADIKKPAETILIGDTTYEKEAGYYMYAKNPALAGTSGTSPWYYPNFRHNMNKSVSFTATTASTKTGRSVFPLPTEGRANFVFLDGHAKSLDVGTAFTLAPKDSSGNYNEDGNILASGETNTYLSHYAFWNIY